MLRELLEQGALHLLPPLSACPGGPPAYLPSAPLQHPLPRQRTELWESVLHSDGPGCASGGGGAQCPSVASDLAARHLLPELLADSTGRV